jgi:hypothetical protein
LRPRSRESDPTCTPPARWPLACLRLPSTNHRSPLSAACRA